MKINRVPHVVIMNLTLSMKYLLNWKSPEIPVQFIDESALKSLAPEVNTEFMGGGNFEDAGLTKCRFDHRPAAATHTMSTAATRLPV